MNTTARAQRNSVSSTTLKSTAPMVLQRKCACGGSAGLTGECSECQSKRLRGGALQTKLRVNKPGDEYEQEADRVAEQVMRVADATVKPEALPSRAAPLVQRRLAGSSSAGIGVAPSIVHDVLSSPGQPLDAASRTFFEPRFGHDFSRVRVHADGKANVSARAIKALAYTVGNQIVFGEGRYAPHTAAGQRLLAHEMTHVLQQRAAASDLMPSSSLQVGQAGDAFEREAEAAANLITSSTHPVAQGLTGEKMRVRRRQPDEEESLKKRETAAWQREAIETTEQKLYEEYKRDCAGVDVLKRLEPFVKPRESPDEVGKELTLVERTEFSPREIVQRLERRVNRLPDILKRREAFKEEIKKPPSEDERKKKDPLDRTDPLILRQVKLRMFDKTFIEPEFGQDYVLGSLEDELAKARCELSKARWEFMVFIRTGRLPGERRIPRG